MGQMSKKPRKFEVRQSKYVTNLWMWMFVMVIFGRISEYRYYRYFCQNIDALSILIFFDTSHHYSSYHCILFPQLLRDNRDCTSNLNRNTVWIHKSRRLLQIKLSFAIFFIKNSSFFTVLWRKMQICISLYVIRSNFRIKSSYRVAIIFHDSSSENRFGKTWQTKCPNVRGQKRIGTNIQIKWVLQTYPRSRISAFICFQLDSEYRSHTRLLFIFFCQIFPLSSHTHKYV